MNTLTLVIVIGIIVVVLALAIKFAFFGKVEKEKTFFGGGGRTTEDGRDRPQEEDSKDTNEG